MTLLLSLMLTFAGEGSWTKVQTGRFMVLYLPGSEGFAQSVSGLLEPELKRVSSFLQTPPPPEITVVLAPDEAGFRELQGRRVSPLVTGMAYPRRRMIFLRPLSGQEVRHSSLKAVVAHEITHVVLAEKLKDRPPPLWLSEGLSVFLGEEPFYSRAERLMPVAVTGRYIPFRQLEESFPDSPSAAAIAYAQSGDFVMFLVREFGEEKLLNYLERLGEGEDPDVALSAIYSRSLGDLEEQWMKHVRRTYGLLPTLSGGALLWFLISLLAVYAYLKKYRESRRAQEKWKEQEDRIFRLESGEGRGGSVSVPQPLPEEWEEEESEEEEKYLH